MPKGAARWSPARLASAASCAVNPLNYADPAVLVRDLFPAPGCTTVVCDRTIPAQRLLQNAAAVLGTVIP